MKTCLKGCCLWIWWWAQNPGRSPKPAIGKKTRMWSRGEWRQTGTCKQQPESHEINYLHALQKGGPLPWSCWRAWPQPWRLTGESLAGPGGAVGSAALPPQREPESVATPVSCHRQRRPPPAFRDQWLLIYFCLWISHSIPWWPLINENNTGDLGTVVSAKLVWQRANLPQIWITQGPSLKSGGMKGKNTKNK